MIPSAFALFRSPGAQGSDAICSAFVKTEKANLGSENGKFSKEPSSMRAKSFFEPRGRGVLAELQGHAVVTVDKGLSVRDSLSKSRKQTRSKTHNVYSKISPARPS